MYVPDNPRAFMINPGILVRKAMQSRFPTLSLMKLPLPEADRDQLAMMTESKLRHVDQLMSALRQIDRTGAYVDPATGAQVPRPVLEKRLADAVDIAYEAKAYLHLNDEWRSQGVERMKVPSYTQEPGYVA